MGDWSSAIYVSSQIFVVISYLLLAWTYFLKRRMILLCVVIASNLTVAIGFGLLTAWTGMGMCVIAIFRDLVSSFLDKHRCAELKNKITRLDCFLLCFWLSAQITVTIFTFDGFWSLFALASTMFFTVSIWQKNKLIYNFLGIFVGISWILYNYFIENFFGFVLESVLLIAVIIGIFYLLHSKKNQPRTS